MITCMIHSLFGKLILKKPQFIAVEANGIGFKIFIPLKIYRRLPKIGSKIRLFCCPFFRQDGLELYGFLEEKELGLFELLNSINGVGPKIALKILSSLSADKLAAIVDRGRTDLLTKISQVGKKTAERIILELRDKIKNKESEEAVFLAEADLDIETALINLGYKKSEIKEALKHLPPKVKKIEDRIKMALKILSKR